MHDDRRIPREQWPSFARPEPTWAHVREVRGAAKIVDASGARAIVPKGASRAAPIPEWPRHIRNAHTKALRVRPAEGPVLEVWVGRCRLQFAPAVGRDGRELRVKRVKAVRFVMPRWQKRMNARRAEAARIADRLQPRLKDGGDVRCLTYEEWFRRTDVRSTASGRPQRTTEAAATKDASAVPLPKPEPPMSAPIPSASTPPTPRTTRGDHRATPKQRRATGYTAAEKAAALKALDEGERITHVARRFGTYPKTIRAWSAQGQHTMKAPSARANRHDVATPSGEPRQVQSPEPVFDTTAEQLAGALTRIATLEEENAFLKRAAKMFAAD